MPSVIPPEPRPPLPACLAEHRRDGPSLAFLGTPEVAAFVLGALLDAGQQVQLVITGADRRRGRGGELSPSPVKAVALERGLPVSERVADVTAAGVELGLVVAFGKLVRPEVLAVVPMLNVHFSLLPRWRGAAPVERAILAGDATTGVSLMALEAGLDTGPVYARLETPIAPGETAVELRRRLAELAVPMLLELLARWPDLGEPRAQEGEALYAAKVAPEERRLDWSRPAVELERTVRIGRAWTTFRGRRLLVHRARRVRLGEGAGDSGPPGTLHGGIAATVDSSAGGWALELGELQSEGRSAQGIEEWSRGNRPVAGERLGE